ncbi:MAG: MFS transporter [Nitrospirota bacterium]
MPSGIWVLGFVSLLMDISSEMIHSLLPLFMVTTLGAGTIAVGIVEGLAESLALVVKVFSGTLSDYLGRRKGLALNDHWSVILAGVALWGIHMGMTQGLLATMVADVAPTDLRGTAYGCFNLACGLAMLIASLLAGFLWDRLGAAFTFYAGACFSVLAIIGTLSSPVTQHRRTG